MACPIRYDQTERYPGYDERELSLWVKDAAGRWNERAVRLPRLPRYRPTATASSRVGAVSRRGRAPGVVTTEGQGGGGGGAVEPLFFSDWAGGAILDGGKWTRWGGDPALSIVDAPAGFPTAMTKVLRVLVGSGTFDWVESDGAWGMPAIGESRAFRCYLLNDVANSVVGGSAATHPGESKGTDGSIDGNFYALHVGSNADGTGEFYLDSGGFGHQWTPPNWTGGTPGTLDKFVVHRLEWKLTRAGTSTYAIAMRIHTVDGDTETPLYDETTLEWWGQSSGNMLSAATAEVLDAFAVTGFRLGINGGFSAGSTQYMYWGGFAVALDWCGAYGNVVGEAA